MLKTTATREEGKPVISNREAAKEGRRQRIVQAARTLIQESGETAFSMRTLADRADVSLATPYNLFGSKQAVLTALLDSDIENYQVKLRKREGDALDMLFSAVTLSRQFFSREPGFYRAVLSSVYAGGTEYRDMFRGPRRAFWRGLVDEAMIGNFLDKRVGIEPFSTNLVLIFFASIMEWVAGEITLIEMERRVDYGFALSLLAVATPRSRSRLEAHLYASQQRLARHSKI